MGEFIYHNAYWPKVVTCECGKTARPRHKYPMDSSHVFCPFCLREVPLETYAKENVNE